MLTSSGNLTFYVDGEEMPLVTSGGIEYQLNIGIVTDGISLCK